MQQATHMISLEGGRQEGYTGLTQRPLLLAGSMGNPCRPRQAAHAWLPAPAGWRGR